jgi:hypothetical protein
VANTLDIVTTFLLPNEVAMGAWQGPEDGRWLQKVFVVRGDTIAKHITDIGPAEDFERIPAELLPGDGETTVAEFLFELERHRHDLFAWNHRQRVKAESTLIHDVAEQREARREYIRGRSVNGPHITVQRSIYNRENAWRKFFDRRAERTGKRTSTREGMR